MLDALCHQVSTSGGWKSTWSKARFPVVSESKASHYTVVETADDVVFVAVRVHAMMMMAVAKRITERRLRVHAMITMAVAKGLPNGGCGARPSLRRQLAPDLTLTTQLRRQLGP